MKHFLFILLGLLPNLGFCQDARKAYMEGIDSMTTGNFESAIILFKTVTELQPENPYGWYNKGIAESFLGMDDEAFLDFKKTTEVDSNYKKGWLNLATAKKRLTDYDGAFVDYRRALAIDSNYHEAYYNLALMFDLFGKKDSACLFYQKAKEIGSKEAINKVEKCSKIDTIKTYSILWLKEKSENKKYGFTEKYPIKVGNGPNGGPANQHTYLNLLRDKMGKKITYERLGSCCMYKSNSSNSLLGMGMLDRYQITYKDEKNNIKQAVIYISFYDYEEPKILYDFETIHLK